MQKNKALSYGNPDLNTLIFVKLYIQQCNENLKRCQRDLTLTASHIKILLLFALPSLALGDSVSGSSLSAASQHRWREPFPATCACVVGLGALVMKVSAMACGLGR